MSYVSILLKPPSRRNITKVSTLFQYIHHKHLLRVTFKVDIQQAQRHSSVRFNTINDTIVDALYCLQNGLLLLPIATRRKLSDFSNEFSSLVIITNLHSSAKAEIYVGSNKLSGGGTYYEVDNFIRHKEYNKPEYAYDIAVVRVKEEIEFNNNVKAIELSTDEIPEGAVAQLTGWGLLSVSKETMCRVNNY